MKISDGIEYAIQQAQLDDLEKTASDDRSFDPANVSTGMLLRKAAQSVRDQGIDGFPKEAGKKKTKNLIKEHQPKLPTFPKKPKKPDVDKTDADWMRTPTKED